MSIQRFETGPRMSQVVVHGNTVYLAGVVAHKAAGESVAKQTQDILSTIDGHLAKAGSDKSKLLSANIYITDMKNFAEMNAAVGRLGFAGQYAGARHGRGQARLPAIQRRDHGGRGEVGEPVQKPSGGRRGRRFFHELTLRARRSSRLRSSARTASGNRSAAHRRRWQAAGSSDRHRTPSAAPR